MSESLSASSSARPAKPSIPLVPLLLGLGGLIPFWALAFSRATGVGLGFPPATISLALAVYGATILAFLGGIRWGLAMRSPDQGSAGYDFGVAVLPQLIGWAGLAVPDPWRFFLLGVVVLALGPLDRNLVVRGLAPAWFGRLRLILSLGAGAALFLAALA